MFGNHMLGPTERSSFEIAPGRWVGFGHPCFIIAEVGQNHQGDIEIAKKLIQSAKECGADCVKFQKTDIPSRFTREVLQNAYSSCNSFGATYGEHKKKLEFTEEQFMELSQYSTELGIYFTASGMDKPSIDFLNNLNVPFFKIGSADCLNLPLLRHAIKYGKPLVISTGMTTYDSLKQMYEKISPFAKHFALLQCTSSYPVAEKEVNLNVIKTYEEEFPKAVIGYSGHEIGIGISIAAVALGAKILERHVTLDHHLKGSDHKASLEPHELKQLVTEVRRVESAMGTYDKRFQDGEKACYEKLGKTIVASVTLPCGSTIKEGMIDVKVAGGQGWDLIKYDELIGGSPSRDFLPEEILVPQDIKPRNDVENRDCCMAQESKF